MSQIVSHVTVLEPVYTFTEFRKCLWRIRTFASSVIMAVSLSFSIMVDCDSSSQLPHCSPLSVPLLLSRHTNEKLALKIKDQSRKIIHLTAERE